MIRAATPADVPVVLDMIRELAAYERAADQVRVTEEQLRDGLFGPNPAIFALVAEEPPGGEPQSGDGEGGYGPGGDGPCGAGEGAAPVPVGFALWFRNFSTWTGTHGVYLEDLYVRPEARGGGHGKALLAELARICVERGYERFEWWVLDWNEPSLGFYRSLGAEPMDEWTVQRLSGEPLRRLAAGAVRAPRITEESNAA